MQVIIYVDLQVNPAETQLIFVLGGAVKQVVSSISQVILDTKIEIGVCVLKVVEVV